jgi:hypothetical protein
MKGARKKGALRDNDAGSSNGWEVVNGIYKREAWGTVRMVEELSSSMLGTN